MECGGSATTGGVELRLANIAKDLERADLEHIFDRFWRKDAARTDRNHIGLGLSIARGLCDMLGLRLSVDLREDRRFEARIVFPPNASVFPPAQRVETSQPRADSGSIEK